MPDLLLDARQLTKRYGDTPVVNDLSFSIAPGECLGVIGPNGAGKTTTIRMCLGLTAPDAGAVTAFGLSMPQESLAVKQRLGVVSEKVSPDMLMVVHLVSPGNRYDLLHLSNFAQLNVRERRLAEQRTDLLHEHRRVLAPREETDRARIHRVRIDDAGDLALAQRLQELAPDEIG